MSAINATCDQCGKTFNVKFKEKLHIKTRKNRLEKITETYFKCPHCKNKYFCFARDDEVIKLQDLIKKEVSPFKRYAMQQEINSKMKKIKERIKR